MKDNIVWVVVALVGAYLLYTLVSRRPTTPQYAPQPAYPYPQPQGQPGQVALPDQTAQYIAASGTLIGGIGAAVGSIVGAASSYGGSDDSSW